MTQKQIEEWSKYKEARNALHQIRVSQCDHKNASGQSAVANDILHGRTCIICGEDIPMSYMEKLLRKTGEIA